MPTVTVYRDGVRIEANLSLDDLKDLMGLKGSTTNQTPLSERHRPTPAPISTPSEQVGYKPFLHEISDRGRDFIQVLRENPDGIEIKALASRLGFNSPTQIGGLTGGGLAKVAKRKKVDLRKVYRKVITNANGVRTLTFYPGELVLNEGRDLFSNEKPAV